jgi:hypothetical protein
MSGMGLAPSAPKKTNFYAGNVERKSGRIKITAVSGALTLRVHYVQIWIDFNLGVNVLLRITAGADGDFKVFISFLSWTYGFVVVVFMTMTFLEGWTNHDGWRLHRLAGLASCLLWPVMLAVFLIHMPFAGHYLCTRPENA